jgi:tetratricopeptide (TPR) repeat protein
MAKTAALVAILCCLACPAALADILVLKDGTVLPKGVKAAAGELPSDEDFEASKGHAVDPAYDVVKAGGKDYPAAQVADVFVYDAEKNLAYKDGEVRASSRFWEEAAESYGAAAEELKGAAKQVALYKRVLCLANLGDLDATLAASDQLLAAFPKSYWFGPVQVKRALIFASRNKADEAVAALKTVAAAGGMNARDAFEAEYTRAWLTKMRDARTKEDVAAAEKEFRDLVEAIERHPRGRQDAADQRLKALGRYTKAMVLQGKVAEARPILDQAIAQATKMTDRGVLSVVRAARGDALFSAAKAAMDSGKKDDAKTLSYEAILDSLYVADFAADFAETSDAFNATQNAARLWRNLFAMTGDKDCELARRAYEWYAAAVNMLPTGEEKRALVREAKALKEIHDKVCAPPDSK